MSALTAEEKQAYMNVIDQAHLSQLKNKAAKGLLYQYASSTDILNEKLSVRTKIDITLFKKALENTPRARLQRLEIEKNEAEEKLQLITRENDRYKQALESLEQAEKNKQTAEDRASKAEQELVLLKKKCHLVNDDREGSIEALRICLEDLTKIAGHCHDQFSDLLPPQSF
jgi:hypothetical protein